MAIFCQTCGRQYDTTRFEFGRTIDCACGARVGFEHRLNLSEGDEIKFFADVNVARLARLLRAVGVDTAWEDAIADARLVETAIRERRFVLTLDKRLVRERRADNIVLLRSDAPPEQFGEVVRRFNLTRPREFFTRCLVCNQVLRSATDEEIARLVPPRVREAQSEFRFCPRCAKVYWAGSHARRMRAAIEGIFERA